MKAFALDSHMTTMSGVFYPTGHIFLMFPSLDAARHAAGRLTDGGVDPQSLSLLTPQTIQEQITRTVSDADTALPSAGTEADTVRVFADLAGQGHHALLVHAPAAEDGEKIMKLLKGSGFSVAKKYRQLVIEDME